MKQMIIAYAGKIYDEARARFNKLELRWQLAGVVVAGAFLFFLLGPVLISSAARGLLEKNGLAAAGAIVRSVGSENSTALSRGDEALYSLESAGEAPGVLAAYLTDSTGLIVAPVGRFHEDARKEAVIKEALKTNELAIIKKGRAYELAAPIFNEKQTLGIAVIRFSPSAAAPWAGIFIFFGSLLLISSVAAGMVLAIFELLKRGGGVFPPAIGEETPAALHSVSCDQHRFSDNIMSPVVFFDKTFRVNYANGPAAALFNGVMERHVADLGREYMEAAEELEMHQAEFVEKNGIRIWRITDGEGTAGYGMTLLK